MSEAALQADDLPLVLVVDDTAENLALMSRLLKKSYRVRLANGGEAALKIAAMLPHPEIILLDVMMPGMDGYEVCRRLKAAPMTRDIPVIFLTARHSTEDEQMGLDVGAVDYITKPISPPVVLARMRNHLSLKVASDYLRNRTAFLEAEIVRSGHELRAVQDATLRLLTVIAENRAPHFAPRLARLRQYVALLAGEARCLPKFGPSLSHEEIERIIRCVPLLDLGSIGRSDLPIATSDQPSAEEAEAIRRHATRGHALLRVPEDGPAGYLRHAADIAYSNHEHWDGRGQPQGLSGDAIPIAGRLTALASAYETMTGGLGGLEGQSHEAAVAEIQRGRGTRFDPDLTDAFLRIADLVKLIADRLGQPAARTLQIASA